MKRVAILQSSYIPWRGYFDLVGSVDEFIFYDDVQYTTRDWRNRNRIKTPQGLLWLTIPVGSSVHRAIRDVTITKPGTGMAHWQRLRANYGRAACYEEVAGWLQSLYCEEEWTSLSAVNERFVRAICQRLGITTRLSRSSDYTLEHGRTERLVSICGQAGASTYVSGPSARAYLDTTAFERAGMDVSWFEYPDYPEHPQLWGPFVGNLSILDLLFNCGAEAPRYMRLGAS
jgi:hypothetical protein